MRKMPVSDKRNRKGLIIVNTGEGKGKSTAAFGIVLRATGNKMNVFIIQFLKGTRRGLNFEISRIDSPSFIKDHEFHFI